ncbi:hypothetical protein [Rhizobium giardinii]|uniref:hypothetical protein n=1 Tax=Rhizobium giardinii TaxID=56731 RepID=UPI0012B56090|nr:hypothetical protein [Rhizobium giardinii]
MREHAKAIQQCWPRKAPQADYFNRTAILTGFAASNSLRVLFLLAARRCQFPNDNHDSKCALATPANPAKGLTDDHLMREKNNGYHDHSD